MSEPCRNHIMLNAAVLTAMGFYELPTGHWKLKREFVKGSWDPRDYYDYTLSAIYVFRKQRGFGYVALTNVHYVDQLQSWYFGCTGEELVYPVKEVVAEKKKAKRKKFVWIPIVGLFFFPDLRSGDLLDVLDYEYWGLYFYHLVSGGLIICLLAFIIHLIIK